MSVLSDCPSLTEPEQTHTARAAEEVWFAPTLHSAWRQSLRFLHDVNSAKIESLLAQSMQLSVTPVMMRCPCMSWRMQRLWSA